MANKGWVGVDLDGTLAESADSWPIDPPWSIGKPIPKMVALVKALLDAGVEVRIFTARLANLTMAQLLAETNNIKAYCKEHIGQELPVTCQKDFNMITCYDDRATQVVPNTGVTMQELVDYLAKSLHFNAYDRPDVGNYPVERMLADMVKRLQKESL